MNRSLCLSLIVGTLLTRTASAQYPPQYYPPQYPPPNYPQPAYYPNPYANQQAYWQRMYYPTTAQAQQGHSYLPPAPPSQGFAPPMSAQNNPMPYPTGSMPIPAYGSLPSGKDPSPILPASTSSATGQKPGEPLQPAGQPTSAAAQPRPEPMMAPPPAPAPAPLPAPADNRWAEPSGKPVISAGGGAYYVKPHFDTNPAYARSTNNPSTVSALTTTTQQNFDWDYGCAPYGWLEYGHCEGLGLRARLWHFDDGPSSLSVSNPFTPGTSSTQVTSAFPLGLGVISNPSGVGAGFNDELLFKSGLTMDVYDIEVTTRFRPGPALVTISGGIRYARMSQFYDVLMESTPAVPGSDRVKSTLNSSHDFQGIGGTLALEVYYPLGNTGLSVFAMGRGSLLYGTGDEQADLLTVTTDPTGFVTTQTLTATTSQDRLRPVGEIEVGVEYARRMGRALVIFQTALVDQVWFGAGNASNNETITGTGTVLSVPATQVSDNHINLGLFGLRASLGIRY